MSKSPPMLTELEAEVSPENLRGSMGQYEYVFARDEDQVQAALRLRYEVFNLELHEGLSESHETGLDKDSFDAVCHHLLILHRPTGAVVGTYRMQTGTMAARNLGYYSEQEFDFKPYEGLRGDVMELGRACIQKEHRNLKALHLLWRGIAAYAVLTRSRYLLGCSSLTSQDMRLGTMMYHRLAQEHLAEPYLLTVPLPALAMDFTDEGDAWQQDCPLPPKLLRAYLGLGGKICGPPALDREFKTIDFLTVLDLAKLPGIVRQHFFGSGERK